MAEKKVTIDDVVKGSADQIITYFQSHAGASFEERMKRIEEFHHPKHEIPEILGQHVEQVVRGDPANRENFPGAYDAGYRKLASIAKNRFDKIENSEDAEAIIESYVDAFLSRAVNNKFAAAMEKAKAAKLSDADIRKMKGNMFAMYHPTKEGRVNPFSEDFIKAFVGKTRIKAEAELRGLAELSTQAYGTYLAAKAQRGLITEDDHLEMAEYVGKKFEAAGFRHPDHPLTKGIETLLQEYQTLLKGGDIGKLGYKMVDKTT